MSRSEWESLCDGCGKCCLHKLEDQETGRLGYTDVACRLLDVATCRCTDYGHRHRRVKDCVKLTPASPKELQWLPSTCAYRLVAEGRDLYWWHPLISGDRNTVHQAGQSIRAWAMAEADAGDLENHILAWEDPVS